jgi:hypothetical protein
MNLAFPAISVAAPTPGAAFRSHAVVAFDMTNAVIDGLTQGATAVNIMSPASIATAQAQVALREIGLALEDATAPSAGITAARAAQELLATGTNELLHGIDGQVPIDAIVSNFSAAKDQLQVALDSTGAAYPR